MDQDRACRTGKATMRQGLGRKRESAHDNKVADHSAHDRHDRASHEGVLHESIRKDLAQVLQQIPCRTGKRVVGHAYAPTTKRCPSDVT